MKQLPLQKKQDSVGRLICIMGIIFISFFLLYSLASIRFSLSNFQHLTRNTGIFAEDIRFVVALFLGTFLSYCLFYFVLRRTTLDHAKMRKIVIFAIVFSLILLGSIPFLSVDLFGTILRSEIASVYKVNPYRVTPMMLGLENVVSWPEQTVLYGPFYTIIALFLQKIGGLSLVANLFIFRMANALIFFACAWFIFKIVYKIRPAQALIFTALFLWNPYILIEVINNGHNDIFLAFFILASVYLIMHNRLLLASLLLIAGFLIKFSTIFLVPLPLLLMLTQKKPARKIILEMSIFVILLSAVVILCYAPFGNIVDSMKSLTGYYYSTDQFTLIKYVIKKVAYLFTGLAQQPQLTPIQIQNFYLVTFLILYFLILLCRRHLTIENVVKKYFWILFLILQLISLFLRPWYVIWIIPLLLLIAHTRYRALIFVFTAYGFLHYITQLAIANSMMILVMVYYLLMIKIAAKKDGEAITDSVI